MEKSIWIKEVNNKEFSISELINYLRENKFDNIVLQSLFEYKDYVDIKITRKKIISLPLFNETEMKKFELRINSKIVIYPKKELVFFFASKNETNLLVNWFSRLAKIDLNEYIIDMNSLLKKLRNKKIDYTIKNIFVAGYETKDKNFGNFDIFDSNKRKIDLINEYSKKVIRITLSLSKIGYEPSDLIINRYGGILFKRKTELRNYIVNLIGEE